MPSPWRALFQALAKAPGAIAWWSMRNNAIFLMAIPAEKEILENRFTGNLRFPFPFDEILSIEFSPNVHDVISNDIGTIERIVTEIPGFSFAMNAEGALRITPVLGDGRA